MAGYAVALTGGIASGKSEIERRFAALGAAVVDADRIARELVEPGRAALHEIVDAFGDTMLSDDGTLDRVAMRSRVFDDPEARLRLEAILHPRIRETMKKRAIAADADYVLLSIPLLVESGGAYDWIDRVLVVDVSLDLQLQRLLLRPGIDAALAENILASQTSREKRLAIADDVIENSGSFAALYAQVERLHLRYRALARGARSDT
ncbi:MAG: dephospho-CoA kinase [Dokdonella sp.]